MNYNDQLRAAQAYLDNMAPDDDEDAFPDYILETIANRYVRANEVGELLTELCEAECFLGTVASSIDLPSDRAFQTLLRRARSLCEDVEAERRRLADEDANEAAEARLCAAEAAGARWHD